MTPADLAPEPHSRTVAPTAVPAVDELDRGLVARLRVDGREGNRSLAKALGVNETTVAARLRRFDEQQMVRVVALTDFEAFGYHCLAFVFVSLNERSATSVADELTGIPEAINVAVVTGRHDIVLTVVAHDRVALARLASEKIAAIPGVDRVRCELAVEVHRYNYSFAAVRQPRESVTPDPALVGVDQLDQAVIGALKRDARISNRRIAQLVGVSEGTVRSRLRRLETSGHVRIQAICDADTFGLRSAAFVGVRANATRIDAVARGLLETREAGVIARTLGQFEFVAVVVAGPRGGLIDTVLARIADIEGVRSTETLVISCAAKHAYTWAKIAPQRLRLTEPLTIAPIEAA